MNAFRCGSKGCEQPVKGIYCDRHREARAAARQAARDGRSQRAKAAWQADPEGMKARLANGKKPAQEGKP